MGILLTLARRARPSARDARWSCSAQTRPDGSLRARVARLLAAAPVTGAPTRRNRESLFGNCGIANPDDPCRRTRRVHRAVALGMVDPDDLRFAGHPVRTRQAVAEMQHLHDVAAVMRSHRDAAPNRLTDTITEHVRSERLTSLRK